MCFISSCRGAKYLPCLLLLLVNTKLNKVACVLTSKKRRYFSILCTGFISCESRGNKCPISFWHSCACVQREKFKKPYLCFVPCVSLALLPSDSSQMGKREHGNSLYLMQSLLCYNFVQNWDEGLLPQATTPWGRRKDLSTQGTVPVIHCTYEHWVSKHLS